MKHSTFLKFMAIVLCAASILTLAGSGLGIWCMVELDLYNKTVDQFLANNYRDSASFYARNIAQQYASTALGGCPEDLVLEHYQVHFENRFDEGGTGYVILDAEGNEIASVNAAITQYAHQAYDFPIEGNYMHLVSAEPVPDTQAEDPGQAGLGEGEYGVIDNLTEAITPVYAIQISHEGGSEGIGSAAPLGFLERLGDGTVQFRRDDIFDLSTGEAEITHITFLDMDDQILYEIADEKAVAIITAEPEGGHSIRLVDPNEDAGTPVYKAIFYGTDPENPIEMLGSSQPIGTAFLDDGGLLNFQLFVESANLKNTANVTSMVLMDQDGSILFAQAQPQLQTGAPVATENGLTFTSDPNAVAVAMPTETAAEEAAPENAPAEAAVQAPADEKTGAPAAPDQADSEAGTAPEQTAGGESAASETIPVETMPEQTVPQETTAPTIPPEATAPPTVPETVAGTIPEPTEPVMINGKALKTYDISTYSYYDSAAQTSMTARVVYLAMPEFTVQVFIRPDLDGNAHTYTLMGLLRQYSFLLLPALLGSLVILALSIVYLCVSAGHRRTGEIKAGGLNRIPLDLYTALAAAAVTGLGALAVITVTDLLPKNMTLGLVLTPLLAYAICVIFVGYCFAWVSQCKTPGGYWWRNSICGRLLTGGVGSLEKGVEWSNRKFFPWLGSIICKLWEFFLLVLAWCYRLLRRIWRKAKALVQDFLRWVFYALKRFFSLLPMTWQWILGGLVLLFLGMLVWANCRDGWGFLWFLAGLGLVLYVSRCFGLLLERTKKMNQGDLDSKIDSKQMLGCFQEFAGDLNSLADVVVVAAQKQLRSERMKTELITNVSHDIKTPLTSIINYVDLLRKPHSDEEGEQYLEVLDRQSQRLKKLIDDLMDMSKANTGNMHAEITRLDAVESVNQALGEFADKLEKAELRPLFRHNADEAYVMADGRLLWRVLSNLLSNAVKYAMPGTRLYVDLMKLEGRVVISLKNISRDELNVDAEELMERFVRGDDSRNTEGSGLGLNIAKSLMELQKGHLQLLVDGDLFKVTLVFPAAE